MVCFLVSEIESTPIDKSLTYLGLAFLHHLFFGASNTFFGQYFMKIPLSLDKYQLLLFHLAIDSVVE